MKSRELEQYMSRRSVSELTESAVDQRTRVLRAEGLLSYGPRGPYAPELPLDEVVNVLMSLRAPTAAETADTVKALRAWPRQEGPFYAKTFGQALDEILTRGPEDCGVAEVRIAKKFDMGLVMLKGGVRVRYGSKRPKVSMIHDEMVISGSALLQLWAKLNHPGRRKSGWGKPEAPAGNG